MKQGGVCMALGETCFLHVNQSMIIRGNLATVRETLKKGKERSHRYLLSVFVYLIPMADDLSIRQTFDSYSDQANDGTLQTQRHAQTSENKLS